MNIKNVKKLIELKLFVSTAISRNESVSSSVTDIHYKEACESETAVLIHDDLYLEYRGYTPNIPPYCAGVLTPYPVCFDINNRRYQMRTKEHTKYFFLGLVNVTLDMDIFLKMENINQNELEEFFNKHQPPIQKHCNTINHISNLDNILVIQSNYLKIVPFSYTRQWYMYEQIISIFIRMGDDALKDLKNIHNRSLLDLYC